MMFIGEAEVQEYLDWQSPHAADKPFGWRGGNGNFQFLETDLEKLRAVGYAGGNCREALPGERKDWYD